MTHTKGPWSVRMPTEFLNQAAIEPCIGCVYGAGEELQANANLIASAPELLEALEACVEQLEHDSRDCYSTGPYTGDHIADLVRCPGCAAISKARAAIAKAKGEV